MIILVSIYTSADKGGKILTPDLARAYMSRAAPDGFLVSVFSGMFHCFYALVVFSRGLYADDFKARCSGSQ